MPIAPELPEPASTLGRIRDRLAALPGVTGIALGGSRARGVARPDSDIDIGLYYDPATRPDFELVLAAAADLDDHGEPAGHGSYGEWGPWINGGVWLVVDGIKTDILLRDQARVEKVVRDAAQGIVTTAYQPGHPHGFVSTIYAGEVCHNLPLHDPQGRLADLRALVSPYPESLLEATVNQFGWEAGFSLHNAHSPARRGDLVQVTGLLYRAVVCMNQVVFAHNGRFVLNEKGALAEAAEMPRVPRDYRARVEAALTGLSTEPRVLQAAVDGLAEVHDELASWTKDV
ncbi:nucleotidyltransferase domain-containing protein [Streptomyces sp. F63]|uniref:nucleotidyltransferase domain-containing protein n=1 Tax=Streptomyces sp. F63 TaxID=2824887 RepID=UPI001B377017|nr:nucleotidyltransferase domain-containing protein [Streptomyces sp. F63]MBQ0983229.1 nucleotidyltransferase domain-containing protein [Streptomyces sp. F63]